MRKKDSGWRTEGTVHNDFIQQHTYTHTHTHKTHDTQTTNNKNKKHTTKNRQGTRRTSQ